MISKKVLDKPVSLGYNEFIKSEEWFLARSLKELDYDEQFSSDQ